MIRMNFGAHYRKICTDVSLRVRTGCPQGQKSTLTSSQKQFALQVNYTYAALPLQLIHFSYMKN